MNKKNDEKVNITFRLSEEENEKLKQYAAACGLSAAEFMRQLCKGNAPQPQPQAEFWQLMNTLYEVHAAFKKCVPYYPDAAETCQEIEEFILELQQAATSPQRFDVEELLEKGAKRGTPQSLLCGEKEHPRSDKPSAVYSGSEERSVM